LQLVFNESNEKAIKKRHLDAKVVKVSIATNGKKIKCIFWKG
jgi:hypothetical protein